MLGRKFRRGLIIQRTMWPMLVVVPAPGSDQDTSLRQTRKPVVIQTLVPESAIEAFDKRILGRFACLNQLELNSMLTSPLVECVTGKFRALVCPDRFGVAPEPSCLIQHPRNVMPRNTEVDH